MFYSILAFLFYCIILCYLPLCMNAPLEFIFIHSLWRSLLHQPTLMCGLTSIEMDGGSEREREGEKERERETSMEGEIE